MIVTNKVINNQDILFSIVIPTYNRAGMIGTAIESVLSQTYANWELIVVDDGSTDNTKEIVESYQDKRIRYFWKENEERSIARNFGIEKAKGTYISFLDDDDYFLPEFLEEFNKKIFTENIPVAIFMCAEYTEDEYGNRQLNYVPMNLLNNPVRMLWKMQTSIRPFVIHKDILSKEKFKEDCPYGEDFHLAIRIVLKYPFYYIKKALSVNIAHKNQGTHSKFRENYRDNAQLSIACMDDLINNYENELFDLIPRSKIFDLYNHKIYGFASASMKHCDFKYWWFLFKKISFEGSFSKTIYYFFSLIIRIKFYFIYCLFRNKP